MSHLFFFFSFFCSFFLVPIPISRCILPHYPYHYYKGLEEGRGRHVSPTKISKRRIRNQLQLSVPNRGSRQSDYIPTGIFFKPEAPSYTFDWLRPDVKFT
ncbi:hypothetical protein F4818DRAFT_418059 [Hypoxylon cercidicola]|nr:hypothetical protein F4818DRAFT_418059 [Hypoxylon cercidicola]